MNAKARRWFEVSPRIAFVRAVSVAASLFAAASCGESAPASPGTMEPGQAVFALRPSFTTLPPGGPLITLSRVRAVLTGPSGDQTVVQANFVGGNATLNFSVQISGQSAEFILDVTAFDSNGAVAFTARQRLILHAGDNNAVPSPELVYDAPDAKVTTVKIVAQGPMTLNAGGSGTLSVTGLLPNGQSLAPLVGWVSRDPSVATVDANGIVKAGQSQGSTFIVATSATGLRDSVQIRVRAPVDKVIVAPGTVQLIRGQTRTIGVELRDATNKLIDDRTAVWTTSDATVATVSATGVVTALKVGKASITATSEGKTGAAEITVVSPLDKIEVTPARIDMSSLKATAPLSFKLVPVTGGSVDGLVPTFTSSNPQVASVSSAGVVTSVGNGSAKITIELEGIIASVDVVVQQVTATVSVAPKVVNVSSIGSTFTFAVTPVDAGGNPLNAPVVTWTSSDPSIATVTNGVVTARRAGTVTITATVDGKSDSATFIISQTARFLVVLTDKFQISTGQTATLSAKIADEGGSPIADASATYTTTTPNVASVSGNVVTGLSAGTAHIVGTAGGFTGSVDIKVVGPPTEGGGQLVLNPATAEKLPGGTQQFTVTSGGSGPFTWTVNGVTGGNATYGTISTAGFYTAPATVPTPPSFDVCAVQASPAAQGCARVTITPIPSAGADVIIINDLNVWDNSNGGSAPDNYVFWKNTATFTGTGPRASQTGYMFDISRSPLCSSYCTITNGYSKMDSTLKSIGFTTVQTAANYPITSIPANIKVLLLVTPRTPFSNSEINVLKRFAGEGGRIIYMGEYEGYFSTADIAVENDFLAKMGAVAHNGGQNFLCSGRSTRINPHQITQGLTSVQFACASRMDVLGPNDYALFLDPTGQAIVGAVAKIDLTPIALEDAPAAAARLQRLRVPFPPVSPGVQTGVDPTKVRPKQ